MSTLKALVFGVLLVFGCGEVVERVVEPEDLAGLAEAYCLANPTLPCGKVYACQTPADTDIGLVEVCIPQIFDGVGGVSDVDVAFAEAVYGDCELSPHERFVSKGTWLCWWCCGEGCGAGCNAMSGCYCPMSFAEHASVAKPEWWPEN